MKKATLQAGDIVQTLGYYNVNDGGQSSYRIRERIDTDEVDEGSIHAISSDLVAELIVPTELKSIVCGDNESSNDSTVLQKILNYEALASEKFI